MNAVVLAVCIFAATSVIDGSEDNQTDSSNAESSENHNFTVLANYLQQSNLTITKETARGDNVTVSFENTGDGNVTISVERPELFNNMTLDEYYDYLAQMESSQDNQTAQVDYHSFPSNYSDSYNQTNQTEISDNSKTVVTEIVNTLESNQTLSVNKNNSTALKNSTFTCKLDVDFDECFGKLFDNQAFVSQGNKNRRPGQYVKVEYSY